MRSTDLAISFFTFLTVLANLATIGILGLAGAARWSRAGPIPRLWSAVRAELTAGGLGLAWLVAAVATGGSLWFSEVAGFQPCRLCWIQRACMYPLTAILAVAALARRRAATEAAAPVDDDVADPTTSPTGPRPPSPAPEPTPATKLAGGAATAVAIRPSSAPSRAPSLRAARAGGLAMVLAGIGALVATYHVLVERFPSLESGACDPRVPCTVVWFERLGFVTLPYMALSGFVLILTLLGTAHLRPQENAQ